MGHGEVTTWFMTREELAAYVAKHPIIPTERPKGASLAKVTEMQRKQAENNKRKKQPTIMDKVDKEDLHKRFMAGERLDDIAKALDITSETLKNFISQQRKSNPDKWPRRQKQNHSIKW